MTLDCDPTIFKSMPYDNWNQSFNNFFKAGIQAPKELECKHYVNHSVFWMSRRYASNAFHFMEDVVTAYETLLVLNRNPRDFELVIIDGREEGKPLFDIWSMFFSTFGVRLLRNKPFPPQTCFKESLIDIHGMASVLTNSLVNVNESIRGNDCYSSLLNSLRQVQACLRFANANNANRHGRVSNLF